jgi:hypothetical protein
VRNDGALAATLRFAAGTLGSIAAGYAVYRGGVFHPGARPFQCVTVGALMAAVLALVRGGRPGPALGVVGGFGLLQIGLVWHKGWPRAFTGFASNVIAAAGIFVAAVIFDLLARRGLRFGKFLVNGPLLGGIYVAVTPIAGLGLPARGAVMVSSLLENLWLGILIGDGVGLGVELAELIPGLFPVRPSEPEQVGSGPRIGGPR